MTEKASLTFLGKTIELPIYKGSENEIGIDVSKLRKETGAITLDPGLGNTGACFSNITFINGEEGILRYRGYPIENLTGKYDFIDVTSLLLNGELPGSEEKQKLSSAINEYSTLAPQVKKLVESFDQSAHPMGMLSAGLAALSGVYPEFNDPDISGDAMNKVFPLVLGQVKALCSEIFCHVSGTEVGKSSSSSYGADFYQMSFGKEAGEVISKALEVLLILHADHEQNCSAFTVRTVGSSKANLFAVLSSGVNALWGPSHGGANQAVIEMLQMIEKDGGGYKKFIEKAKDKSDPFKLMGFGHRVYKNFDPRAKIIKKACDDILDLLKVDDPLLDLAKGLEDEARKDSYFVERNLYPNVDFYSGIIYKALNIPSEMFTVMFALGRLPGWMAQWKEQVSDPKMRITRPRQIYMGPTQR